MALLRCREAVMARFRPMLREHGLSEQQWRILRALCATGPLRAGDLAQLTLLSAPSVSRLVRSLSERGLIRRAPNADDLRATTITVTARGRKLVDRIAPLSEAIYAEIGGAIGSRDLDHLYGLLDDATSRLGLEAVAGEDA
jgi:homoprotocatechuate degradation regulator HpaR